MPLAPLTVSTQSGNKLRTYVFEARHIGGIQEHDKENNCDELPKSVSLTGSQKLHDDDLQGSQQLPQVLSEKQCPRTPANRIPLADLIGNTEDAFNCNPKVTTPEDHIYWQHGPTPRSSVPPATASSAQRGKKRAQSSSPVSSSQNQKSAHLSAQETLNLKTLHESLKTPHHDPALDLWARYTGATLTKKDPDGNALPAFAQLMTSSPQTPSTTNGKDNALRRSISCGIEWPASKAKKRKLNQAVSGGRMKDIFAASEIDITTSGKSKTSRLTLLMEKLQENSRKVSQSKISGPSSSSPLPNRTGMSKTRVVCPFSKQIAAQPKNDIDDITNELDHQPMHDISGQQHNGPDSPSSEFGDEGLALDVLEAVEQSACADAASPAAEERCEDLTMTNDATRQIRAENSDQSGNPQSSCRPAGDMLDLAQQSHVDQNTTALHVRPSTFDVEDDDEFEDGSDDNGVMADLAARFDTQENRYTPSAQPRVKQMPLQQDAGYIDRPNPAQGANDDEDAYDDDDDDLWNQIGDGSLVLQQENGVATTSQVRVVL